MGIVIADDSIVSGHLLDATLRKWGYEVVVACDGVEAWNILQSPDAPKLVILDWVMPGLTGLEVCRRVRESAKDSENPQNKENYTYILLLTSKNLKEDLIDGMEAGADDYITKPFDQHELKVRLRAGTRVVDVQKQLLAAREELREQATKDSLTGLWNRSSIVEQLHRELSRSQRELLPVGLVMVDLDHFKSMNDTHGHFAGDAVLREAARRMQDSTRMYDSIGRYGGEEFLILLPNCDEESTQRQAERMRCHLAQAPVGEFEHSFTLTASFGATCASAGYPASVEGLIRRADEAMYLAKKHGRNRVEYLSYSSEAEPPELLMAQDVVR